MRQALLVVAAVFGLAACQSTPPGGGGAAPDVPSQRNIRAAPAFTCADGTVFTAVFYVGSDDVELRFPDGSSSTLQPQVAASGAKYQNAQHLFWNKGEEAQYAFARRAETTCRVAK
jgi:membrane-bound inhibitor of C-type lysozyme